MNERDSARASQLVRAMAEIHRREGFPGVVAMAGYLNFLAMENPRFNLKKLMKKTSRITDELAHRLSEAERGAARQVPA